MLIPGSLKLPLPPEQEAVGLGLHPTRPCARVNFHGGLEVNESLALVAARAQNMGLHQPALGYLERLPRCLKRLAQWAHIRHRRAIALEGSYPSDVELDPQRLSIRCNLQRRTVDGVGGLKPSFQPKNNAVTIGLDPRGDRIHTHPFITGAIEQGFGLIVLAFCKRHFTERAQHDRQAFCIARLLSKQPTLSVQIGLVNLGGMFRGR